VLDYSKSFLPMYILISCALEDRLRRADTAFLGSQHISPSSKPYRLAGIGPIVVSCASVVPSSDVRTGGLSSSDYRNGLRRGRPRGEMRYCAVETSPGCLLADENAGAPGGSEDHGSAAVEALSLFTSRAFVDAFTEGSSPKSP
jgi:hypothetical protein